MVTVLPSCIFHLTHECPVSEIIWIYLLICHSNYNCKAFKTFYVLIYLYIWVIYMFFCCCWTCFFGYSFRKVIIIADTLFNVSMMKTGCKRIRLCFFCHQYQQLHFLYIPQTEECSQIDNNFFIDFASLGFTNYFLFFDRDVTESN